MDAGPPLVTFDATFGTNGVATFGTSHDEQLGVFGCARQADGKIVVLEDSRADDPLELPDHERPGHLVVQRVDAAGVPDTSFGQNGRVVLPIAFRAYRASIVVEADQKIVVGAGLLQTANSVETTIHGGVLARLMPNGDLDTTFGTGGLDVGPQFFIDAAAVSDAVVIESQAGNGFHTARYGAPDGTNSTAEVFDVARQPDGQLLVATSIEALDGHGNVQRIDRDGFLDKTFALGLPSQTAEASHAYAVVDDGDGTILVGGGELLGSTTFTPTIARYTQANALDTTFGGGKGFVQPSGNGDVRFMRRLDDGRVAYVVNDNGTSSTVGRLTANGVVDPSYTSAIPFSGARSFALAPASGVVYACGATATDARVDIVAADGKTVAPVLVHPGLVEASATYMLANPAGGVFVAEVSGGNRELIVRAVDATGASTKEIPVPTDLEAITKLALAKSGKLLVAGPGGIDPDTQEEDFTIVALEPSTGILDATFGDAGVMRLSLSTTSTIATAADLVVDATGRLIVSVNDGFNGAALFRFNADGSHDDTFFGDSFELTTPLDAGDDAIRLSATADGKLFAAGLASGDVLTVLRYSSAGVVEKTGTPPNGLVGPRVTALVPTADGAVLVGGHTDDVAFVVRFTSDLGLDPKFGTNGVVIRPLRATYGAGPALVVTADGIALATTVIDAFREHTIVERLASNGLVTPVGVIPDVGVFGLSAQADGKIVAAGHVWNATGSQSWVARF